MSAVGKDRVTGLLTLLLDYILSDELDKSTLPGSEVCAVAMMKIANPCHSTLAMISFIYGGRAPSFLCFSYMVYC